LNAFIECFIHFPVSDNYFISHRPLPQPLSAGEGSLGIF
jgi:hypothetical protein